MAEDGQVRSIDGRSIDGRGAGSTVGRGAGSTVGRGAGSTVELGTDPVGRGEDHRAEVVDLPLPDRDVADLAAVLDRLVAREAGSVGDLATVEALQRQLHRLESVVTRSVGQMESAGEWAATGAQTASAWLSVACSLPRGRARRSVRRARFLRTRPHLEAAWQAGQLGADHVDAFLSVAGRVADPVLDRDEELLVGHASTLTFAAFTRALAYWHQHADPDGTEAAAEARRARRDVSLHASFDGTWLGTITLDEVDGTIVSEALARIEAELFEADRAAASPGGRLPRTGAQRRADALVEMAVRSATAPADGRRPAPLLTVLVDLDTFTGRVCELANRQVVTPGSLLRFLEPADLERAVFSGPARIEVGPTHRLFTGALRRAVEVRDRECTHPFCEVPAARCQVDHIDPWSEGGRTLLRNARLLCPFHNRLRILLETMERELPRPPGRPQPDRDRPPGRPHPDRDRPPDDG